MLTRYFVSCKQADGNTGRQDTCGNSLNSPDQRRTVSAHAAESTLNFFGGAG